MPARARTRGFCRIEWFGAGFARQRCPKAYRQTSVESFRRHDHDHVQYIRRRHEPRHEPRAAAGLGGLARQDVPSGRRDTYTNWARAQCEATRAQMRKQRTQNWWFSQRPRSRGAGSQKTFNCCFKKLNHNGSRVLRTLGIMALSVPRTESHDHQVVNKSRARSQQ
jgi:hypothetical protein